MPYGKASGAPGQAASKGSKGFAQARSQAASKDSKGYDRVFDKSEPFTAVGDPCDGSAANVPAAARLLAHLP